MKHLIIAAWAMLLLIACSPQSVDTTAVPMEQITEKPNYVPQGWIAKTLPEIAAGVKAGEVTSEELVQAYIDRINRVDRDGPTLQSVLSLNPNALADARAADAKRAAGDTLGLLHGVPILLKDNIETKDPLATTAGALALKANITGRDSPLVAGLRDAGAIILGKANLSQWANFRSNDSMSGWTALGGQVRNPHMLDRNPCGSSSGSGAGAASSMAAGAVGTETNGSVICPSNANGVVGFKPTVPVNDAGCLIEPPVSVPIVAGVKSAARALAEPPEEPPGTVFSFTGFITLPKKLVSLEEPIAYSSQFNLPKRKAPSDHRLLVIVDSYVGIKFSSILLPAVVLTPFVQNKSFTAKGTPGNIDS